MNLGDESDNHDYSSSLQPNQVKTVEEALHHAGQGGLYQIRMLLIFFAQWMVSVFIFVGPVYYFPDPELTCPDGSPTATCTEDNGGCVLGILKPSQYSTITSDFNLYCENRDYRSIAQSAFFWGPIFGNILFSFLADWKGRRVSLIIAWTLSTIGIFGITFSYSIYSLIFTILLTGFSLVPCNNLNLIMVNEQSGEEFRQRGSTFLLMSWAVFEIILVPIAKYITDWRDIFLYFIAIPAGVICFLTFAYVFESPRFLLTKNLREEMYQTINKIASANSKPPISEKDLYIQPVEQQYSMKVYTYLDLVKYKSLRKITAASCIVMFFTQMIYYATQYSLGSLGSDLYINALVVGGGEVIAYFLCNQFIQKFPRKLFTLIFFSTSLVFCSLFALVSSDVLQTILAGAVRICNCGTLGILALFVEELYPTTVRSLGVGAQMSIGVAGSSLAPIIINQAKRLSINPLLAAAVLALSAVYPISFFRETKGKPLLDDISELKLDEQQITDDKQKQPFIDQII